MDITKIDLINYNLEVSGYTETNDISKIPARSFEITFNGLTNPNMEQLLQDMQIMNQIRSSPNPGVKDAFDQVLTLLALTK